MVVTATAFVAGLSAGALLTHLLLRKELSSRASEAQAIMNGAKELAEANLRVAQVNQNTVDRLVVAFGSDTALEVVNGQAGRQGDVPLSDEVPLSTATHAAARPRSRDDVRGDAHFPRKHWQ